MDDAVSVRDFIAQEETVAGKADFTAQRKVTEDVGKGSAQQMGTLVVLADDDASRRKFASKHRPVEVMVGIIQRQVPAADKNGVFGGKI